MAVSSVQVLGTRQTRPSFLKSVTAPLHSPSPDEPHTLASILHLTNSVTQNVLAFNIFDPTKTHVSFDRARSPLAGENDVDVTINLHEKPRFAAQTGTWAGDGEATAQMSARAENLFGGAERVEGTLEAGTRTRKAWEVKVQSPIAARSDVLGEVSVFGMARDYKFFASHELVQRGAHLKLKVHTPIRICVTNCGQTLSNVGVHDVMVSTILRQVTALTSMASPTVIESAGDTIKTSLAHTITRDRRDDTLLPSQGYLLKSTQEFAGLGGGDVRFLKATGEVQLIKTFPIWPRTHFVFGVRGGLLWSLERAKGTRVTDRFLLGGPTDVRGFREFGIGPKDGSTYHDPFSVGRG
jgi:outer membrane protein insertion porin family